jgi:hypothetical protein
MKTTKNLFSAFILSFIVIPAFSMGVYENNDDTIKFKISDKSIFEIYNVDSDADLEQLQIQIEEFVKNISDAVKNLEKISSDTTINIKMLNEEETIIIEESLKYDNDDFNFKYTEPYDDEEDYVFDYDYDDEIIDYDYDWGGNKYWDTDYNKKSFRRIENEVYFSIGLNNYLENGMFPNNEEAQYSVKPWGSFDVGFGGIMKLYLARPFSLDFGYGLSWYNFKYQDKSTRILKNDDGVEFISAANVNTSFKKSKIVVPYINLSVIPTLDFSKFNTSNKLGLRIGAGVYAGYRIGGRVKQVYFEDGVRCVYKHKNSYYLSTLRYGVKAIVGVGSDMDIYASYDLNTLYAKGKAPELNPISFGIILRFGV